MLQMKEKLQPRHRMTVNEETINTRLIGYHKNAFTDKTSTVLLENLRRRFLISFSVLSWRQMLHLNTLQSQLVRYTRLCRRLF